MVKDKFWKGKPKPVTAWAALDRNGDIMPASVRPRAEDVQLYCGKDCVPIRVIISFDDDNK